jgi:hypothetical protein
LPYSSSYHGTYYPSSGRTPPRLTSLADREKVTEPADFSVSPEQWGNFLCALFGVMQKRAPANVLEAIRKKEF